MDKDTIRIAVGLSLGSSLCRLHTCHHSGAEVHSLATHGFSCRWSEGCHFRHAALNDITLRALSSAKIPSRLEPSGIYRSDRKWPNGISDVPWKNSKLLVWDATSTDIFAPSYIACATSNAGVVTALTKERKLVLYGYLIPSHYFFPIAFETSGVIDPQSRLLYRSWPIASS